MTPGTDDASRLFSDAVNLYKVGDYSRAWEICNAILQKNPKHAESHGLIGAMFLKSNRCREAIDPLRRAVSLDPRNPVLRDSLGQALEKAGSPDEADAEYRQALAAKPDFTPALLNRGRLLKAQERYDEAEACFREALRHRPGSATALNNLGTLLKAMDRQDEAQSCFEELIRVAPEIAEAHNNLAGILKMKGRKEEALAGYRRALELKPGLAQACTNLADLLMEKNLPDEAESCLRSALKQNPGNAEIMYRIGLCAQGRSAFEAALNIYAKILKSDPEHFESVLNTAICFQSRGYMEGAIEYYEKAVRLKPDSGLAYGFLGKAYHDMKRYDEALANMRRGLELLPDNRKTRYDLVYLRLFLCDLEAWEESEKELLSLLGEELENQELLPATPMLMLHYFRVPPPLCLAVAKKYAGFLDKKVENVKRGWERGYRERGRRLRVGYLSPDFRQHAVGILVHDIFRHHDRDRFEFFAYSLTEQKEKDAYRQRIESGIEHFRDISRTSYPDAARLIHDDGINILVDLGGYTSFTRTEIPALRPAPVQVQFLGYPGTMGADFIQYAVADPVLVPGGLAAHYSEKIIYLPHAFPGSPTAVARCGIGRKEIGLPEDGFVYCSFNAASKIDPQSFRTWMSIMKKTPGSALWLIRDNGHMEKNLKEAARARGIEPERLVFTDRVSFDEFMARHELADLFLDSFLYNAGSTAVNAIAAGLPLLTCPGPHFTARMGASVCRAAGLDELICSGAGEYEERAAGLARDRAALDSLKERVRAAAGSALFDMKRFAASLERAYETAWEIHKEGDGPRSFSVNGGG